MRFLVTKIFCNEYLFYIYAENEKKLWEKIIQKHLK